jgi:hypothetical protein
VRALLREPEHKLGIPVLGNEYLAFVFIKRYEVLMGQPVSSLQSQMKSTHWPGPALNSYFKLGMHRILFLPDIRPAGYPANPKAGYRISG